MHPALYITLVFLLPSVIAGGLMALDALRNAPEADEDENGFTYTPGFGELRPARVRVAPSAPPRSEEN